MIDAHKQPLDALFTFSRIPREKEPYGRRRQANMHMRNVTLTFYLGRKIIALTGKRRHVECWHENGNAFHRTLYFEILCHVPE